MYTKTRYRKYQDGGAVPLDVQVNTPAAHIAADKATADLMEAVVPTGREATILQWQRAGLSDRQAEFLRANSDLVDDPGTLEAAVKHAHGLGHQADTPEYFDEIRSYGDRHIGVVDDVAAPPAAPERQRGESEHEDYEPPSERNFSGPISLKMTERSSPGTYNSRGERSGQVHMTPAMKEHARAAGISETEYALGVLRLRQEKADGRYGGEP